MAGSTIHSVDGHSVDRRRADVRRAMFRPLVLAGVSLCAVLAASPELVVGQAWARRDLIPQKPSVEVNLEVLSQLTVATAPFQMGISQAELPPHGMAAPVAAPAAAPAPASAAVPLPPPPTSAGGASYQPSASALDLPPAMAAMMPASAPKVSPPPPGRMVPVQNQAYQRETHVGRTPSVPAAAVAPVVSAPPVSPPVVAAHRPMPPVSTPPARPSAVAPVRLSSYRRAEPATAAADEPFFFGDRNPPAVAKSAPKMPAAAAKAEPAKPQPTTPEPVKAPPTTAKVLPAATPTLPPVAVEPATAPLPEPKLNEMDFGSFPTLPPAVPAATNPPVAGQPVAGQSAPMMPSLNKGFDDFLTKDQPAAPASALPDVSVLTGESTAAPMAEVGTALPPIDGLAAPVGAPPTLPPPPMAAPAPEKPVIVRAEPKVELPKAELKTEPKAEPSIPDIELPPLPEGKPDEAPAAKPAAKAEPKQFAPEPTPSLPALPEMNEAQVKAEAKQEPKAEPVATPAALPELPGAPDLPQFDLPDENELELASLPQPGEPLPAEGAASEEKKDAAAELKPLPAQASGASLLKVEFATTENEVPVSGQKQLSALASQIAASKQAIVIRSFIRDSEESSGIVGNRIATGRSFAVRSLLIDKGISHFNISIDNSVGKLKGNATEYVEILAK